ncbi:hypothetical protein [Microvirga flavescens]|uniref:hypothetical protein n=1 Tax=Microvirga flavescens TaxID=2249811 RepID=UPI000DD92F0A|nr:hypothetical protein [Microvirga flavescens]
MAIRKSLLALTLLASSLYATQASAIFSYGERPPPRGLNGTAVTGLTDQELAAGVTYGNNESKAAMLKSVVLPDGSRVLVK